MDQNTKLIFYVTRANEVYQLYMGGTGSSDQFLKFSFETAVFSLSMAMRILSSMFWFVIFVFWVLKCEEVNFVKYSLACANGTSISISWHAMYNLWQPACLRPRAARCAHDIIAVL